MVDHFALLRAVQKRGCPVEQTNKQSWQGSIRFATLNVTFSEIVCAVREGVGERGAVGMSEVGEWLWVREWSVLGGDCVWG
jgi:hypothetical protein